MKIKLLVFAVLLQASYSFGQSIYPNVINCSGNSFQKNNFQVEWSIGEVPLVSQMDAPQSSLVITNGFLQAYTLDLNPFSMGNIFTSHEVRIYPNPATEYVEVNFLTLQKGKVSLRLYDAAGKTVYAGETTSYGIDLIHRIPVKNLAAGTYSLYITLNSLRGYFSKTGVYKIVTIQ